MNFESRRPGGGLSTAAAAGRRGLERLQPRFPPARIAGEIVFWFVILFTITGASSVLGLDAFVAWLLQIAAYLPILLAGMLITLAGVIISALTRDVMAAAAHKAGIAQAAILLTAVAVGIDQIGVDISFISVVGVALAFGVGARDYMGNIIAGRQLRGLYRVGNRLRIRDIEETVAELTTTKVVLVSERGRFMIPALLFEQEVALVAEHGDSEAG